jgi:hypothetical protein
MKDAKITQTEAKTRDGFLASLHSLISSLFQKYLRRQTKRLMLYLLKSDYLKYYC